MAKKKEPLVINQIIMKAPQRKTYDVGQWRSALQAADAGRVKSLYDLYDDILIDGVLSDAIDKRTEAILNASITFVDDKGNEIEEVASLINSEAGEELLRAIMSQRFYGRAAVEISLKDGFDCYRIAPQHILLEKKAIALNAIGDKAVLYEDRKNVLVLGKPLEYGLLLKATPFAIYKRGGFGDYAQWIELFGMPQRIGKYSTYDPEGRKLLEDAFENAGSAPWMVVPKEAEIETNSNSSGSGTSYNEFREACNEEMLITILGQTLTTVQGDKGARSLGEVHLEVERSKHDSDLRFVERILNERVRPILEHEGLNLKGGRFLFPREAQPLSVNEIVSLSSVLDIPASFLYDKYAIPRPQDDDDIVGRQKESAQPQKKEDEPIENTDNRGFLLRMWDFFVGAPQVGATMIGAAPTLSDANTLEERLIARTPNAKGFDVELFEYFSNNFIKAFRKGWDATELADAATQATEYVIKDDALKTAMEINLYRFSAAKTLAEVRELNQIFRESKSYSDFKNKAMVICPKFNKRWQRTEFDTAQLSAQSASRYQQLIRKQKLFPYWQYRTIRDGHVRPEHQKLDGIVLPASDPRWDKLFPPNDWNCRCRVKPLLKNEFDGDLQEMRERADAYINSEAWTKSHANGWGINRAKEGLVFAENQFYVNTYSKGAQKVLNSLKHTDYGLPTIEDCVAKATDEMPIYEGTAEEWYQQHPTLTDYLGRQIVMPEDAFIKHTTREKYIKQGRIKMLNALIEILKNPDEVWLNDHSQKKQDVHFIKYFNGQAIDVVCSLDNLKYAISTWFQIVVSDKTRHLYRRGLLIKK